MSLSVTERLLAMRTSVSNFKILDEIWLGMSPLSPAVCACRSLFWMHVLALVFELGIVAITLLSLLSNMCHPDSQESPEALEEQREQVITTVVSLGTTLVTFVLTMAGAGDAVQGMRRVGTQIIAVVKRISAAGQMVSTAGQRVSSVGQKMSEAGFIAVPTIGASTIDAPPKADSPSTQCLNMTNNDGEVRRRSISIGSQAP